MITRIYLYNRLLETLGCVQKIRKTLKIYFRRRIGRKQSQLRRAYGKGPRVQQKLHMKSFHSTNNIKRNRLIIIKKSFASYSAQSMIRNILSTKPSSFFSYSIDCCNYFCCFQNTDSRATMLCINLSHPPGMSYIVSSR